MKRIHRKKGREYHKHGKSQKYLDLNLKFKSKYREEAKKYLDRTLGELRESNTGKIFSLLKRLGSQPGEADDSGFTILSHESESLSPEQAANRIADHFAAISQTFLPLSIELLPDRVRAKLQSKIQPPKISEYETYKTILSAKKTKAGVPNDIPKAIFKEFAPELAESAIKNLESGEWPKHWKVELVIPIPKTRNSCNEDDLRPISLTPFLSKLTEKFVVNWLLEHIGDKIDFRQYGGQKGNSTSHYIIEFLNFILSCQDSRNEQIAVLACMVDFEKAFMRQDHSILITKLSDLNVPGWLLRLVVTFLSERKMVVLYKGAISDVKFMPGGGPQGTMLALLLFLVLVNDLGFSNQCNNAGLLARAKRDIKTYNEIHLKYVDDLSLAEAVDLASQLESKSIESRPQPDPFHSRTGHILPMDKSRVFRKLLETEQYAAENQMKINYRKTKLVLFNPCRKFDFQPEFQIGGNVLEVVEEFKLLGLTIRSDLKWHSNTKNMIVKANKRLWVLRRLNNMGASQEDLLTVYKSQVRCILEYAAPTWQGALTVAEKNDLERVQKSACKIILSSGLLTYKEALKKLNLECLEDRRNKLSLNFAIKAERHPKFSNWFVPKKNTANTRSTSLKYVPVKDNHARYEKSPLSFLTTLLNKHYAQTKTKKS